MRSFGLIGTALPVLFGCLSTTAHSNTLLGCILRTMAIRCHYQLLLIEHFCTFDSKTYSAAFNFSGIYGLVTVEDFRCSIYKWTNEQMGLQECHPLKSCWLYILNLHINQVFHLDLQFQGQYRWYLPQVENLNHCCIDFGQIWFLLTWIH